MQPSPQASPPSSDSSRCQQPIMDAPKPDDDEALPVPLVGTGRWEEFIREQTQREPFPVPLIILLECLPARLQQRLLDLLRSLRRSRLMMPADVKEGRSLESQTRLEMALDFVERQRKRRANETNSPRSESTASSSVVSSKNHPRTDPDADVDLDMDLDLDLDLDSEINSPETALLGNSIPEPRGGHGGLDAESSQPYFETEVNEFLGDDVDESQLEMDHLKPHLNRFHKRKNKQTTRESYKQSHNHNYNQKGFTSPTGQPHQQQQRAQESHAIQIEKGSNRPVIPKEDIHAQVEQGQPGFPMAEKNEDDHDEAESQPDSEDIAELERAVDDIMRKINLESSKDKQHGRNDGRHQGNLGSGQSPIQLFQSAHNLPRPSLDGKSHSQPTGHTQVRTSSSNTQTKTPKSLGIGGEGIHNAKAKDGELTKGKEAKDAYADTKRNRIALLTQMQRAAALAGPPEEEIQRWSATQQAYFAWQFFALWIGAMQLYWAPFGTGLVGVQDVPGVIRWIQKYSPYPPRFLHTTYTIVIALVIGFITTGAAMSLARTQDLVAVFGLRACAYGRSVWFFVMVGMAMPVFSILFSVFLCTPTSSPSNRGGQYFEDIDEYFSAYTGEYDEDFEGTQKDGRVDDDSKPHQSTHLVHAIDPNITCWSPTHGVLCAAAMFCAVVFFISFYIKRNQVHSRLEQAKSNPTSFFYERNPVFFLTLLVTKIAFCLISIFGTEEGASDPTDGEENQDNPNTSDPVLPASLFLCCILLCTLIVNYRISYENVRAHGLQSAIVFSTSVAQIIAVVGHSFRFWTIVWMTIVVFFISYYLFVGWALYVKWRMFCRPPQGLFHHTEGRSFFPRPSHQSYAVDPDDDSDADEGSGGAFAAARWVFKKARCAGRCLVHSTKGLCTRNPTDAGNSGRNSDSNNNTASARMAANREAWRCNGPKAGSAYDEAGRLAQDIIRASKNYSNAEVCGLRNEGYGMYSNPRGPQQGHGQAIVCRADIDVTGGVGGAWVGLTHYTWAHIWKGSGAYANVVAMDLSGNGLDSALVRGLCFALLGERIPLIRLDLSNNSLGLSSALWLSALVRHHMTLRHLILNQNDGLGSAGFHQVMQGVVGGVGSGAGTQLSTLSMDFCGLGADCGPTLARVLRRLHWHRLRDLSLRGNRLGPRLARVLARVLPTLPPSALHLHLEWNGIGPRGIALILAALHHNPHHIAALPGLDSVARIGFRFNGLTRDQMRRLLADSRLARAGATLSPAYDPIVCGATPVAVAHRELAALGLLAPPMAVQDSPLIRELGGEDMFSLIVDDFFYRALKDPLLKMFFLDYNMNRMVHFLKAFLIVGMGGRARKPSVDLQKHHHHLNLTDDLFDAAVGHLLDAIQYGHPGISLETVSSAAKFMESFRPLIVAPSLPLTSPSSPQPPTQTHVHVHVHVTAPKTDADRPTATATATSPQPPRSPALSQKLPPLVGHGHSPASSPSLHGRTLVLPFNAAMLDTIPGSLLQQGATTATTTATATGSAHMTVPAAYVPHRSRHSPLGPSPSVSTTTSPTFYLRSSSIEPPRAHRHSLQSQSGDSVHEFVFDDGVGDGSIGAATEMNPLHSRESSIVILRVT